MPTYVAFLRAVNVGKRQVKMERLRNHLSDNGFTDVATHIASGNLQVTTPLRSATKVASALHETISAEFGFDVPAVVRTPAALRTTADEIDAMESKLGADARIYVVFLDGPADAEGARALTAWDVAGERADVHRDHVVLWLDVPAHSTSLTNARIEKLTGRIATTRDVKVVRALAEKWGA